MEKIKWKRVIKTNILLLKLIGLWPRGDETYKKNYYTVYSFFCIGFILCGHNVFQTAIVFFVLHDLQALTGTIFISLSCICPILKVYSLIQNMGTLKNLFVIIGHDMFQPKNARQALIVKSNTKFWKTIYKIHSFLCCVCTFLWTTYPMLDGTTKVSRLPFLAWYPYNTKISPFYEITYFYQVVCISYIVLINMNIDLLIAALNMLLATQCDILCDDLRHLAQNGAAKFNNNLLKHIKHHKAILSFADKSNKFFNWIVLFQFFTSAISLGFSMFQLTLVAPFTSEFWSFVCYAAAIIHQIFIFCWFGNEVDLKSSSIPYAAFESNWIDASLEAKRNLIMFIIRTQRPIKMSALNLFYLSIDTFKAILRTSWSYFAVLRQAQM